MPDGRLNGGVSAEAIGSTPCSKVSSSSSAAAGSGGEAGGGKMKKGPWTTAEDTILLEYVRRHGEGNWNAVQRNSGLSRCGKSCRLRWANHLRPNLRKGPFSPDEERLILELHSKLGNKWARMAAQLPGRTDNEIKNYWNTRIKRRQRAGLPLYPNEIQRQTGLHHHHPHRPSAAATPFSLFDFAGAPQVFAGTPNRIIDSADSQSFMEPLPAREANTQNRSSSGSLSMTLSSNPFLPPQLQNTVFLFSPQGSCDFSSSSSLQHSRQSFSVKMELPSSQLFSSSNESLATGRNDSELLDSLLFDAGGGNVAYDSRNAGGSGFRWDYPKIPSNYYLGKRDAREDDGAVQDDLSGLLELIPMASTREWSADGGYVSGSDGGREISTGQSSGLTEDNTGLQALPAVTGEDDGKSIGSCRWTDLPEAS